MDSKYNRDKNRIPELASRDILATSVSVHQCIIAPIYTSRLSITFTISETTKTIKSTVQLN